MPRPQLAFRWLPIAAPGEQIDNIVLRAQIQIEPLSAAIGRRSKPHLRDLFGRAGSLGPDAAPLLWTHASVVVPAFTGQTTVDLPVPCTFDFNVAATNIFMRSKTAKCRCAPVQRHRFL